MSTDKIPNPQKKTDSQQLKEKMANFLQTKGITLHRFLMLNGISVPAWYRILNNYDVYFSTVTRIVRATDGFITFQDIADILPPVEMPCYLAKKIPQIVEDVIEQKMKEQSANIEFGKDTLKM